MYLRFVLKQIDERTGKYFGLFTVAYNLIDEKLLTQYEEEHIQELINWFKKNLPIPDRFSKSKNASHKNTQGLSWFKPSSTEAISKMREVKSIVENYGFPVEILKTDRPGYVVYEDEFQVVAEPFHREDIKQ